MVFGCRSHAPPPVFVVRRSAPNERGGSSSGLGTFGQPAFPCPACCTRGRVRDLAGFLATHPKASALLQDPGRAGKTSPMAVLPTPPPAYPNRRPQRVHNLEANTGLQHPLSTLHERTVAVSHARLASGWRAAASTGEGVEPSGSLAKGFRLHFHSPFQDLSCRKGGLCQEARLPGPHAVLAYPSRYTHRIAIANSRLVAFRRRGA